ncbi:N-lysine methyltransferase KMT5A [Holothuria leucospilota]|uniref:N-lysine methyltransferase KMT5A n=1 Tax=Holothuria leucospilota TaxID=206669 RepID=A0A9Q1H6L9_HOLLE|nr:N-lysine methyltransferase KMT5A [Holothuria leucospilota]
MNFSRKMRRSRRRQEQIVNPAKEAEKYCKEDKDKTHIEKRFVSNEIGWGVITTTARTKGEFLLEYAGDEITADEATRREGLYEEKGLGSFLFYFGRNKCIDATVDNGRLGRFVNDAVGSKENCVMKPLKIGGTTRLCLFAKWDIDAGEELRYDYGIDDLPWRKVCYSCISNISEW